MNYVSAVSSNLYVATSGSNQFPYDTPAKAATSIHDAVDKAVGGCTVFVGNGNFPTTKRIILSEGIRLIGNGPGATTLQRNPVAGSFAMLSLEHANAFVSGLSIANGVGAWATPGGINVAAGTASNCFVYGITTQGIAVPVSGLLVDCVVSNTTVNYPVYVYNGGGVENCRIVKNNSVDFAGMFIAAGGVARRCRVYSNTGHKSYVQDTISLSGRLENSLVYDNTIPSRNFSAGVAVKSGGVMDNCTVCSNTAASATSGGAGVRQSGGTVRNSIVWDNTGPAPANYAKTGGDVSYSCAPELTPGVQGNIAGNPLFATVPKPPFSLHFGSPCINAGVNQTGMETAVDLAGNPRLRGGRVDMGVYEFNLLGTVLVVR